MTNITVRLAELRDAPQIGKIHVKTWQCAYKGQIPDAYLDSLSIEKRQNSWEEILSKGEPETKTFVAETEDKILGFASVGPCKDKEMPSTIGELWAIYVDPDQMGKGAGFLLLKTCLDYLRELKFIRAVLWVLTSNQKTRDWYESKGWKVEGKTTVDVRDGFELHETRYIINL